MLKDKLTIVIPYYNNLSGLDRLLETIPVDKVNVIVVDDNSDVGQSADKIKFKYPSVKYLVNDSLVSNAGSARNSGIRHVLTPYVMFADSDDYYCEGAFDFLQSIFYVDFDCAYFLTETKVEIEDDQGNRNKFYNDLVMNHLSNNDESIRYQFHVPWSKIISMELINKNGIKFDETPVSNDVYFSTLVGIKSNDIKSFSKYVYCVVKNGFGISTDLSPVKSRVRLDVNTRCNYLLMKHNVECNQFIATKGVFVRSKINVFKKSDRKILFDYIRYGFDIIKYRIKKSL